MINKLTIHHLNQLGSCGVFAYWSYNALSDKKVQAQIYSTTERRRWRESTLWGENPLEEANDYLNIAQVPGRFAYTPFLEAPHYEPTRLVVNGKEYQPLDRWKNRLHNATI